MLLDRGAGRGGDRVGEDHRDRHRHPHGGAGLRGDRVQQHRRARPACLVGEGLAVAVAAGFPVPSHPWWVWRPKSCRRTRSYPRGPHRLASAIPQAGPDPTHVTRTPLVSLHQLRLYYLRLPPGNGGWGRRKAAAGPSAPRDHRPSLSMGTWMDTVDATGNKDANVG